MDNALGGGWQELKELEMNLVRAKAVILEMNFGSRAPYDHFVRELQRDPSLTKNILRGRIAKAGASLRLELLGASRRIEEMVDRWKQFIVARADGPELAA